MNTETCPCFRCCDSECTRRFAPFGCATCDFHDCTQCVHWETALDDCVYPRISDIHKYYEEMEKNHE